MAGSVNKVILVGHLGRDPEVRHTQVGTTIVNMSMATSETWRDKATNERKERTEWHRIVIFNEVLADVASKYLRKGSKVYVEGQLATRKWTDKDNAEHYTTEVVIARFGGALVLLDRQQTGPGSPSSPDDYGTTRAAGATAAPRRDPLDDDVPF